MKDLLIIILLGLLLWGGIKGMTALASYVNVGGGTMVVAASDTTSDATKKRINQSAIQEMKKNDQPTAPTEPPQLATTNPEMAPSKGEQAMAAVRGQRMDADGQLRDKDDFYQERDQQKEKTPYNHPSTTPWRVLQQQKNNASADLTDEAEQQLAMAQKGQALQGEFPQQAPPTKEVFNIEKGEKEKVATIDPHQPATDTPASYSQTSGSGPFAVIGGSFTNLDGAQTELTRFKNLDYPNATIVTLDGKHLIILNRYLTRDDARKAAKRIEGKGVDCYVKGF